MRKIIEIGSGARIVRVYFNREFDEYVARLYVDGKHYAPADYFTDDRGDAIATGQSMAKG